MSDFADIAEMFQSVDGHTKLELLLDYARRLPPLPAELEAQRDAGLAKVEECQTPTFLWVGQDDHGMLKIHAWVAQESPTVAGFLGILLESLNGKPPETVEQIPEDLIGAVGLTAQIRMTRVVGISAMVHRIKNGARELQKTQ